MVDIRTRIEKLITVTYAEFFVNLNEYKKSPAIILRDKLATDLHNLFLQLAKELVVERKELDKPNRMENSIDRWIGILRFKASEYEHKARAKGETICSPSIDCVCNEMLAFKDDMKVREVK